jgi:FKBP-type peptidyl-prolyl cis-trans isomerase SlyD
MICCLVFRLLTRSSRENYKKRKQSARFDFLTIFAVQFQHFISTSVSFNLKYKIMTVSQNKVVSLTYELKIDNASGEVVDVADASQPLVFLFGAGNLLPKFEDNIANLKANDTFEFTLQAADAYGELSQEAIISLPIDIFLVDGKIDPDMLRIGNVIPMQDNEGHPLEGVVKAVEDDAVIMDFNHPMAGKTLYFTGSILELRDATQEEISHGHVHGPHGHHH